MQATEKNEREYARFPIELTARFRPLATDEEVEAVTEDLLDKPSVWGPPGESELWKLADSPQTGADGLLARAILELAAQVERLNRRVIDRDGPMEIGEIRQISVGGAKFTTPLVLSPGTRLLLSWIDEVDAAPPLRILAKVVHRDGDQEGLYGLSFVAMHPIDKERLTRFIYSLQRKLIRRSHRET